MSASSKPTRRPRSASATARFAATVDFPTPPFPELTANTCSIPATRFRSGVGAGTECGRSGRPPCARAACCRCAWSASGSLTSILARATPSTASTAARASRTSVPGSSGRTANWNRTLPSASTSSPLTWPPLNTSTPVAGCFTRDSASRTRPSSASRSIAITVSLSCRRPAPPGAPAVRRGPERARSERVHRLHGRNRHHDPAFDSLLQRHHRDRARAARAHEAQMDDAIFLVVVDQLDIPAVGVQCRPDRAEDLLDLFACTHRILLPETGHGVAVRAAVRAASHRPAAAVSVQSTRRVYPRSTAGVPAEKPRGGADPPRHRAARGGRSPARAQAPQPGPVHHEQRGRDHHQQTAGHELPPRLELHRADVVLARGLERG